jgi:hypothetical protein
MIDVVTKKSKEFISKLITRDKAKNTELWEFVLQKKYSIKS